MKNTAITSSGGYLKKYISKAIFFLCLYVSRKTTSKCLIVFFYEPEMPECLYKEESMI